MTLTQYEPREGQVAALSDKVVALTKLLFGDSTEKKTAKPAPAGPKDEDNGEHAAGGHRPRGQRRATSGHCRRDYSALETEEIVPTTRPKNRPARSVELPTNHSARRPPTRSTGQLRIVHRRPTYRKTRASAGARRRGGPAPPKVIRKVLFTAGFCARLLVEKYVRRHLVGTLHPLSVLAALLDQAIGERNAQARHLHVDETSWKVFEGPRQGEQQVVAVDLRRGRHRGVHHRPDPLDPRAHQASG
ncbi:MAG: hypothetical protein ACRDZ5_04740 [Acidimicrobiales bacterium]